MPNEAIAIYRRARHRAFEHIDRLRVQLEDWLSLHEDGPVSLADLALLEGLSAERDRVIVDLKKAEAVLMEALLLRRLD